MLDSLGFIKIWHAEHNSSPLLRHLLLLSIPALEDHYFPALTEVRKRRRRGDGKKLRNDEQAWKESQKQPEISTKNVRSAEKLRRQQTQHVKWSQKD